MESFSLSKLNSYIKRVITLNFQEPIWVSAELLSLKEKNGHVYLELTEKDIEKNTLAQNSAIIWKATYANIEKSSKYDLERILKEGNEVRLLVAVDYNVKYGLKLIVQNIDSEYTYGKIAQFRLLTIERLKLESIWQKNKNCIMPLAIKNIAIIASKESAGFKDFENHIKENPFGYTFNDSLFNVTVQGINSVKEICLALHKINQKNINFDVIVLIRGGGSKRDLLEFDSFEIAKEISLSSIPVLTGIGHFIDESIADLSAYESLKTPTAVADFILSKNREFELKNLHLLETVKQFSKQIISGLSFDLSAIYNDIFNKTKMQTFDRHKKLSELQIILNQKAYNLSYGEYKKLAELAIIIESNDPDLILQKGYSLTYMENTLISKCTSIVEGDEIKTIFKNGILTSNINKKWESKS